MKVLRRMTATEADVLSVVIFDTSRLVAAASQLCRPTHTSVATIFSSLIAAAAAAPAAGRAGSRMSPPPRRLAPPALVRQSPAPGDAHRGRVDAIDESSRPHRFSTPPPSVRRIVPASGCHLLNSVVPSRDSRDFASFVC